MTRLRLNPSLLKVPHYIAGRSIEELQEEYGLTEVVKLASNENPFGLSPLALNAFRDALKDAHRYPGIADRLLRRRLASHYNSRYGTSFTEHAFLVGNGAQDVLRMITHALIFEGGEAVICTPTFPMYRIFVEEFGGKCVAVPHKDYRYDLRGVANAITPDTRLVFICNPNNPTGTLVSRGEVEAFAKQVPPSVLLVFDETYYDFVDNPNSSKVVDLASQELDNVVLVRSFSKIYGMANLRVGYALGAKETIHYLSHARMVFNTGDPVLYAAIAALEDHEHVERVRKLIAEEKRFLYEGFARLGLSYVPTTANFILLVTLRSDARAIYEGLLRRGVAVRPVDSFGIENAIRVTIGKREENERLLEALGEVLGR